MIDFREANLLDPVWWKHCQIILRELVREDDVRLQRGILDFHLALVGNSGLTEDSFKASQEHARNAIFDMMGLVRPWEGLSSADRKTKEYKELVDEYIREFGDPKDPEFQAREAKALETWRQQLASRPNETDIERVMRLRREQDNRIRDYRGLKPVRQGR